MVFFVILNFPESVYKGMGVLFCLKLKRLSEEATKDITSLP